MLCSYVFNSVSGAEMAAPVLLYCMSVVMLAWLYSRDFHVFVLRRNASDKDAQQYLEKELALRMQLGLLQVSMYRITAVCVTSARKEDASAADNDEVAALDDFDGVDFKKNSTESEEKQEKSKETKKKRQSNSKRKSKSKMKKKKSKQKKATSKQPKRERKRPHKTASISSFHTEQEEESISSSSTYCPSEELLRESVLAAADIGMAARLTPSYWIENAMWQIPRMR